MHKTIQELKKGAGTIMSLRQYERHLLINSIFRRSECVLGSYLRQEFGSDIHFPHVQAVASEVMKRYPDADWLAVRGAIGRVMRENDKENFAAAWEKLGQLKWYLDTHTLVQKRTERG